METLIAVLTFIALYGFAFYHYYTMEVIKI